MNDIGKIILIIRDELAVNLKIDPSALDIIIENLKIRLEKNLIIPDGEKIKSEGL